MHNVGVNQAMSRVAENFRKSSNDTEAMSFPQRNRLHIRAYDHVKLHGGKTGPSSFLEGVLAHQRAEALTTSFSRYHVTGVGHMRAPSNVVFPENVSAEDSSALTDDERAMFVG